MKTYHKDFLLTLTYHLRTFCYLTLFSTIRCLIMHKWNFLLSKPACLSILITSLHEIQENLKHFRLGESAKDQNFQLETA